MRILIRAASIARGAFKISLIAGGFAIALSVVSGLTRRELPWLRTPDLSLAREAGRMDHFRGAVDLVTSQRAQRRVAEEGETFGLGAVFGLQKNSTASLVTEGNWRVELQGEGRFVLEDARTNTLHTRHTIQWRVLNGTFLARPREYDPSEHWMELRTPLARILLENADVGVKLSEGGHGQVWILSGKGVVLWDDGRKKELQIKGMEYL